MKVDDPSELDIDSLPKCRYRFQRGMYKGEFCDRPITNGTGYCVICVKKRNVQLSLGL